MLWTLLCMGMSLALSPFINHNGLAWNHLLTGPDWGGRWRVYMPPFLLSILFCPQMLRKCISHTCIVFFFSCEKSARPPPPGGGGGPHFHWKLCHIRVNCSQKSTLNEDSRGDQKTPLTGDMGQLSHPKCRLLSCLQNQLYPKPGLFAYFIPKTRIRYQKRLLSILTLIF